MNEYNIKFRDIRGQPFIFTVRLALGLFLTVLLSPVILFLSYIFGNIEYFFVTTMVFIIFGISISCFVVFNEKKCYKNINLIIDDEYININRGENKIYYNTINDITFNKIYSRTLLYIANELIINYNKTDTYTLVIHGGDKKNYKTFIDFYSALKIRSESTKLIESENVRKEID